MHFYVPVISGGLKTMHFEHMSVFSLVYFAYTKVMHLRLFVGVHVHWHRGDD